MRCIQPAVWAASGRRSRLAWCWPLEGPCRNRRQFAPCRAHCPYMWLPTRATCCAGRRLPTSIRCAIGTSRKRPLLAEGRGSPWRPIAAVEKSGSCRDGQLTGAAANSHYRPMLLKNATFWRSGIAASVQRERIGSRGSFFCLGDLVLRQFTLPWWSLLVLLRTTASPFVASSARSPPEETRREHHLAHAGAVDQVSGFA